MIQSPIVFLSILFRLFLWQRKAGFLMIDHTSLFTEIVHPYLPKLYILIYRNCTLLFTETVHYYLPIMVHCYLPITAFHLLQIRKRCRFVGKLDLIFIFEVFAYQKEVKYK